VNKRSLALYVLAAVPLMAYAAETTPLTIHRVCSGSEAKTERLSLSYWSADVARGNPDPACVLREPELAGLPFRAARVEPDPQGIGAVAVIELEESARPRIEEMTKKNKGNLVAFVVDNRVVSIAMITRPYSDNRILVSTSSRADAERIVAAASPRKSSGKR